MDRTKKDLKWLWITLPLTIVFLLAVGFVYYGKPEKYDVIVFGDSRIQGAGLADTIPSLIEARIGLRTLNAGMGGTTLSLNSADIYAERENAYSMVSLARYAGMKDFRAIAGRGKSNALFFENRTEYRETAERLSRTDLSKASYIVIAHGVNDAMTETVADGTEDPGTFEGALRISVNLIKQAAPKAKIILVTPVEYFLEGEERNDLIGEYAKIEAETAKECGLILVDAYEASGITKDNYQSFLSDGIHYNEEATGRVADLVIKVIKEAENESTLGNSQSH
ncbi:MAG: hypothetical protein K6E19_01320 [Lachnospiraceae bacterium]|nr:hypothetical protein [Lachnospiraceae bacterium]